MLRLRRRLEPCCAISRTDSLLRRSTSMTRSGRSRKIFSRAWVRFSSLMGAALVCAPQSRPAAIRAASTNVCIVRIDTPLCYSVLFCCCRLWPGLFSDARRFARADGHDRPAPCPGAVCVFWGRAVLPPSQAGQSCLDCYARAVQSTTAAFLAVRCCPRPFPPIRGLPVFCLFCRVLFWGGCAATEDPLRQ